MKIEYVFGGLALLGIIAIVTYIQKPKRNSEGFFGASGRLTTFSASSSKKMCARRNLDGSVTYISNNYSDTCPKPWKSVKYFGDRDGI